jgi:dTDP-glucose 4,6-dehydratase
MMPEKRDLRILVTGGAGFIGSNFIQLLMKERSEWRIVNFDLLTYAGSEAKVERTSGKSNYSFIKGDVSKQKDIERLFSQRFDYLVNFAAETHVDRSLYDPGLFLRTNVIGTQLLLNAALKSGISRFVQISTDEVYGSLGAEGSFSESSPFQPNSPYAASKASADLVCRAYFRTFDLPVVIARPSNNYGPRQYPEKLIPFFVTKALNDEPLPLYGDGLHIRDWLYVEDCCRGILTVLEKGKIGEAYNLGGKSELTNLEITKLILDFLGKPIGLIKMVKDRPGHDRRYSLDNTRAEKKLDWRPQTEFKAGLKKTLEWYSSNRDWLERVKDTRFRRFHDLHYKDRS